MKLLNRLENVLRSSSWASINWHSVSLSHANHSVESIFVWNSEIGNGRKRTIEQRPYRWIGSKSYVSALLSGKKPLTLRIAKVLHQKLGIPAVVLLA